MGDADAVEVLGHGTLWFGDAHAVVVEDDEHLAFEHAGVVEPFHGDAVDDRGVADEGDGAAAIGIGIGVVGFVVDLVAACHADGGGDAGAGVSDTELVVMGLAGFWEPGHALAGAEVCEFVEAAGEEFMGVALVADIEEEAVVAEVKDAVHGDGEFDDAEVGGEVAAGTGNLVDDGCANFSRQIFELGDGHIAELGGGCE